MKLNSTRNEDMGCPDHQQALPPFSGPVFISGVWRSGTSLLYALLNKHPQVGLFYEGDLPLLRPMFHFRHTRKNWLEKWEYWNAAVSRHSLDSFRAPTSISSLAEAAEAAGREYCAKKGARVWGCKSPSYYDCLVGLARDFPSARFVIIWRDPEEICRSITNAAASSRWFASAGMQHRAIKACEMLDEQCHELVARDIPVHQIHYKELVGNTAEIMRGICRFLDLPFVSAVTCLEGADRSSVFPGAHHSRVNGANILSVGERGRALPSGIERKVRGYKALWKAEKGEQWLLCRYLGEISKIKPSIMQRAIDNCVFFLLRMKDASGPLAYSITPLRLWRLYRAVKYRDADYIKYHNRASIDEPTARKTRQYAAKQST